LFGTFAVILAVAGLAVSAQREPDDGDLAAASAGRTIALRTLGSGGTEAVPIEVYVARVLAGEGEPNAPDGATQALAIAIRTYATFNAGRHRADGFDLCDSTHCQVPRPATPVTRRAARATAGRVLAYRGAPAEIFYSASCGGRTESADQVWPKTNLPYLRSVEDDVHADDVPWTLDVSLRAAQQALAREGFTGSQLRNIEVEARRPSGRVARLKLSGLRPDTITGEQFRTLIGARQFRSTAFEVERSGASLRFTGTGYGHGVGMCVIGAGRRARRGESAEAILAKYFPGLDVVTIGGAGARDTRTAPEPRTEATAALNTAAPTTASSTAASRTPDPNPAARNPATRNSPGFAPIVVAVPAGSLLAAAPLEQLAAGALAALSTMLGTTTMAPVTVTVHETLDSFRAATGRPWWVSAVSAGSSIQLAPPALLAQREGVDAVLKMAIAELLVAPALGDRPAWVRVGAARYYARPVAITAPRSRVQCPSDAELLQAVSAVAQREAETRAEACFARALGGRRDWRDVR
jgi:SpoIID/LytB domain protein